MTLGCAVTASRHYKKRQQESLEASPAAPGMWLPALVSLCALCVMPAAAQEDTTFPNMSYALILPAQLYYPSKDRVCIQCRDILPMYLILGIKTKDNYYFLGDFPRAADIYTCREFQVPPPSGGQEIMSFTLRALWVGDFTYWSITCNVLVTAVTSTPWVQMDKLIYKPGSTVKWRIVSMDQNFKVSNESLPLVELKDPSQKLIAQWTEVPAEEGISEITWQLDEESPKGNYTISVGSSQTTFYVKEYVLPRFEVLVQAPASVFIQDQVFPVQVSGRRNTGRTRVQGTVWMKICQEPYSMYKHVAETLCYEHSAPTNERGGFSKDVSTSHFNLSHSYYKRELGVQASLVEDGTGVEVHATSKSIPISSQATTLEFKEAKKYFQKAIPYTAKVLVRDSKRQPVANKNVTLSYGPDPDTWKSVMDTTDISGLVSFTLDTSSWNQETLSLQATTDEELYKYKTNILYPSSGIAFLRIRQLHSYTNSSISIRPVEGTLACGQALEVYVDYTISGEDIENKNQYVSFFLLVVSKHGLVYNDMTQMLVTSTEPQGSFSIFLDVDTISPSASVVVYTVNGAKAVAVGSARLEVSKCFTYNVSLKFSEEKASPGANVTLQLSATPGARCAILAVEEGVLRSPGSGLSSDEVHRLFTYNDQVKFHEILRDPDPCISTTVSPPITSTPITSTTFVYKYFLTPYRADKLDPKRIFQEAGLQVSSNWKMEAPVECVYPRYPHPVTDGAMKTGSATEAETEAPVKESQEWFPEAWLWNLTTIGDFGTDEMKVVVPDTITEWKAVMFCIVNSSFSMSPTVSLTVYKPFFVVLSVPSLITIREKFFVNAEVFNNLQACLQICIQLEPSQDFIPATSSVTLQCFCLCNGKAKIFQWNLTAKKVGLLSLAVSAEVQKTTELCDGQPTVVLETGRTDKVIKSLLVKE